MEYVESFDLFGTKVSQVPCIKGKGAPSMTTEGAVGCLYMNTDTGTVYKCTAAENGVYTWVEFSGGGGSGSTEGAVLYTAQNLTPEQKAQARANIGAAGLDDNGEPVGAAVLFTEQTLTDAQKSQARENIGAADAVEVSYMLPNFIESKETVYAHGEEDWAKIGCRTTLATTDKHVGHCIPINKASLPQSVRGIKVALEFNAPEMPVVLELYDQNKNLIKTLAEETITAYKIPGLASFDIYGVIHTFDCEFDKTIIDTDVAYLCFRIPNITSTSTERIYVCYTGTVRSEIDVSETPRYLTIVTSPDTWRPVEKAAYTNADETTFIHIIGKTLEVDSDKIKPPAFDYSVYGLPILEFSGNISMMNKDNAVDLTYKYGEREGNCTLKWQGSSSLAHPKKNYTVKFDTAFEAKEGWGEQKKYCLKANYIDFSHSRNICCAKLWGGVVKTRVPENATLNALPNGGAIDGFPICVAINGEYKGVYTFNIPKDGWMFGMGDGEAEAILCADASARGACSFEALATLAGDFDVEYAPDEDNTDWIKTSINRLIQACMDSDGTDLDTSIAQYLDWESAIDYYAFCLATMNYDGITKNYLLGTYDGVKWFFSAYDMDSTFGLCIDGSKMLRADSVCSVSHLANTHKVFNLIKTYKASELKARYKELVNRWNSTATDAWYGALSEEVVTETFTNFAGSIPKALLDEEVKIWTTLPSTSVNNITQITDFYRRRRPLIDAEIEAL